MSRAPGPIFGSLIESKTYTDPDEGWGALRILNKLPQTRQIRVNLNMHRSCTGTILYRRALGISILLLVFGDAVAQNSGSKFPNSEEQSVSATSLKATTRLVLIDVVVTDSSGSPVTDLKGSDFELLEKGRIQQIRVFSYHGQELTHATQPSHTTDSKDLYSNVQNASETSGVPTLIVLDGMNTGLPEWARASEQTVRYLKSLPANHPVAVYTLRRYLRVIQDFTRNPTEAASALNRYNKEFSRSLSHPHDLKVVDASADISEESIRSQLEVTETEAQIDRSVGNKRVRITLEALQDVARAASGFQGRKNLIWISSGFPLYLREGSAGPITSYEELLHAATNALADAQVSVYPIDPRGLSGPAMTGFGFTGTAKSGRLLNGNDLGDTIASGERGLLPVHDAMNKVAQTTGGKAIYTSNFLDQAIDRASKDGSSYYTLGYYPLDQKWDGAFRDVRVNIRGRSHLTVRSRSGYFANADNVLPSEAARQRLENELARSLRIGTPEMRALPLLVKIADPENNGKLRITYLIPPKVLSLSSEADGKRHGSLEYAVRVYNASGKEISVHAGTFDAQLSAEQMLKADRKLLTFSQDLSLPTGSFLLKIGTVDLRSGLVGTVNASRRIIHAAPPKLEKRGESLKQ
jgi:VWFA-related protein